MRDILTTTALCALVIATPALAQAGEGDSQSAEASSATAQSAEAERERSGDILVTARRREESIRDVPGTISAVTSDQLEARGPTSNTGDLLNTVPGVRFNDLSSENLAEVSIRGSGTMRATGADSGVGLFVNGAYVGASVLGGRNFKALDYFDLERVEVLEGPQGALYGRNSEFGVVNIVLAKPQFRNTGYLRDTFTFGLNQNRLAAVVNQVLSEQVASRIGFEVYGQTKGFYYNPTQNKYYDSTNGWTGRAQLRHRSGPLDVTLMLDAQDLSLPTFNNRLTIPGGGVNPQVPLGYMQPRFIRPSEGQNGMQQKVQRAMLMASYDMGWATLESTSMFSKLRSSQQYGASTDLADLVLMRQQGQIGIYPYGQVKTDVRDRTLYQDLHLTGKSDDGNLTWIAGVEGLQQTDRYQITIASSPCAFNLTASVCAGTPTLPTCVKPLPTSANCPTPFPLAFGSDSRTRQRVYSAAAYASVQYNMGNFSAAGEARITHDYKTASLIAYSLYTTTVTRPNTTFVFKADQPAWTLTLSYKIPDASRTLLYAKVGTGYRAGGVNNGVFNPAALNPFRSTYDNEDTIGYEVGVKSNLTRNIYARLTGYLSRTHDAITSINDGCTLTNACGTGQQFFNVNGGTIHARGLQGAIDGRFQLGDGLLTIGLNAATQRAYFYKVPTGVTGLPIQGTPVAQIPDWTMSASVDYRHRISETTSIFFNVNYTGQRGGGQDTVTVATPFIPLTDFDIFGARAGVNFKGIQIAGFVRNFTDAELQLLKFFQAGYPLSARYNAPRTFGATVSYRW